MGESGSGKTTLLNILAALDTPTKGRVLLDGKDMTQIKEKDLAAFRRENLGFVFQDFNLLDTFSSRTTSSCPWCWRGRGFRSWRRRSSRWWRRWRSIVC